MFTLLVYTFSKFSGRREWHTQHPSLLMCRLALESAKSANYLSDWKIIDPQNNIVGSPEIDANEAYKEVNGG